MPETLIPISNNEVKVYYQSPFQKVTAEDLNRLSGAEFTHSIVPALLSAILATIGRDTETAIGFDLHLENSNTIRVSSGIIIRPDSVYIVPELVLSPSAGSLEGIFEIELSKNLTDTKAVQVFNTVTERFQPLAKPTRKSFTSQVFEQWSPVSGLPSVTQNRLGLLSYRKSATNGPITTISRILPVYDPRLIGIDVDLDPGILENDSLADAINWIFNHFENKDFIKTTPSPGFDDANLRFRTQGNYAYWSKDEGGHWLPFA
ncbi:hypothetical protein [Leptospira kmetyi]|uniref:Uncharacterized protein n=1 Tax=Leptospira kmetyi TaxID=408139 RepID=A0ABX4N7B5_9LEPT|nr:hypothetical protein [Leptospira kmetyi]PJZ29080.1 hypothetical protein CH378_14430 [Leptospira kmetyi]PJZ39754.1 hypothetical protein CH370_20085 [Leptospira kmetyi]